MIYYSKIILYILYLFLVENIYCNITKKEIFIFISKLSDLAMALGI